MFATHSQSPLPGDKEIFEGLDYFDYDPNLRFVLPVENGVENGRTGDTATRRRFACGYEGSDGSGSPEALEGLSLSLFWIEGYGGGVFLPFKDSTSGRGDVRWR